MYMVEHLESNTLYCVQGRHGSQTIRKLAQSIPGFVEILQVEDSVVMSDHFRGKIRTLTRDPWEKFQSGLKWYLDRLEGPSNEESYDYDTTKKIIRTMIGSTIKSSSLQSHMTHLDMGGLTDEARTELSRRNLFLSPLVDIQPRDHFDYTMGEGHMTFTHLSMVFLVALGLDVEIFDITNIHRIHSDFGFKAPGTNDQGNYVMDDLKKQYYSDITEIYLDSLDELSQDDWFSGFYHPSSQEFKELMSWEYRAYNALNSDNVAEECKNFVIDLIKAMLDNDSKIEKTYLKQCRQSGNLTNKILNQIPYKSELYPVVCILSDFTFGYTPGDWIDYLEDCKKLLSKPYS